MKYNKGFGTMGILIAVLAVLLIGGIVYTLGKNSNSTSATEQNSLNDKAASGTPVALYEGDGFTVNYPYPSSYVSTSDSFSNTNHFSFNDGDCISSECSPQIIVYVENDLNSQVALTSFVKDKFLNLIPADNKINVKNITVNNQPAIQYTYQGFAGGYDGTVYLTQSFQNGKGYVILLVNSPVNKYLEFLNSFAFTTTGSIREYGNDVNGQHIGYIKTISSGSLTIDYVQWIGCPADIQTGECMNGYKIVNTNPQLRTFPIASNVVIKLQTYSHQTSGIDSGNFNWNQIVSTATFTSALNNPTALYPAKNLLYWITLKNGIVTDITEQYQP